MRFKKGDVIIGPSVSELLKTEVCHKSMNRDEGGYTILCNVLQDRTMLCLSHDKWENVNCPECLALKNIQ